MPRLQIPLPSVFPFETHLSVRISDLNYGQHLGNDAVLALFHEARVRYLHSLGFTEFDIGGIGLIQTDAAIQYIAQGNWGQKLRIEVACAPCSRTSVDFFFRTSDAGSGSPVAVGQTTLVFFDYAKQKIQKIPELFLEKNPTRVPALSTKIRR